MPYGMSCGWAPGGLAARVAGGESALLPAAGGEGGEADHVADGEDVRLGRAVRGVHRQSAAGVRLEAGRL